MFRSVLGGAVLVLGVACGSVSDGPAKVEHFAVDDGDMLPTLQPGATVGVLEETQFGWGDIVAFRTSDGGVRFARVIASPRDRVAVHDGSVWINGHAEDPAKRGAPVAQWKVPEDVYVLRRDSRRTWTGPRQGMFDVASDQIIGMICGLRLVVICEGA